MDSFSGPLVLPEVKQEPDLDLSMSQSQMSQGSVFSSWYYATPTPTPPVSNSFARNLLENVESFVSQGDSYTELTKRMKSSDLDLTLATKLKIVKVMREFVQEMTQVLTQSTDELLLLAVLDFCHVLYSDVIAVSRTLYLTPSIVMAYFASFRGLLDHGGLKVKELGLKVLIQVLKTMEKNGKFEVDAYPPILDFILSADLDNCFINCFHLKEKQIFNAAIEIFSILMSLTTFPKERIELTVSLSLRVAHLTISEDAVDRDLYFNFLWTAFNALGTGIPVLFERRIMALFDTLLFRNNVPAGPEVYYHLGQFTEKEINLKEILHKVLQFSTLVQISKLLKVPNFKEDLASVLLASDVFIKSLDDNLSSVLTVEAIPVETLEVIRGLMELIQGGVEVKSQARICWSLSKVAAAIAVVNVDRVMATLIPLLTVFIGILKTNFKNPLVKILGLDTKEGLNSIWNALNQIELVIQNLGLRTILTVDEDALIWKMLLELHEFGARQRTPVAASDLQGFASWYENQIQKKSTQYFLRAYLSRVTCRQASTSCLDYLEAYARLDGDQASQSERSTGLRRYLLLARNGLLKDIGEWLVEEDMDTNEMDALSDLNLERRNQLANYINSFVDF